MEFRISIAGGLPAFAFWLTTSLLAQDSASPKAEDLEFFEKKVRPVLVENCYVCHSQDHKEAGGLRVDDYRALIRGGANGPAVVPGDSSKSLLIQRITHADDKKTMPPDYRLSESQIQDIRTWIDGGAAWPPLVIPTDIDQSLDPNAKLHPELHENHWAWQPLSSPTVPVLPAENPLFKWPKVDVDHFIAQRLSQAELSPSSDAARATLIRRLSYDLTGLPPSEDDFLSVLLDDSPQAIESYVDRLLKSPAFGEKWGRHWLDVARYGESTGSARNLPYPHAWRYRDYVIEAFNEDKPFDQFLQEQIAGDLLPARSLAEKRSQFIATGFLALGVKDVNQRFKVRYDMDNVDEQIDAVSRAVLGLTVSCARCHDHKFDPISTRDYYALAGIFASTELCDALRNQMGGGGLAYYVPDRLILLSDEKPAVQGPELEQLIAQKKSEAETARAEFIAIRDSVKQKDRGEEQTKKLQKARQFMQQKQAELVALTDPAKSGPVAIGVRESKTIGDTEIRIRGEAEKLGPSVPRGFLSVLDHVPTPTIEPGRSGRYELARWLTDRSNSLTARVAVNRVWKHLFGEGIVRTVDNFGSTGDLPSHPELLDYLAKKFVEDGWSHKKLIRHLVLSRTYQLSSEGTELAISKDPANRWLWRHSPRRLDAEEIRDSILAMSGQLIKSRPETSPSQELPVIEVRNNGPEAAKILTHARDSKVRSVYLPLMRGIVPNSLEVFDFAEQSLVTGKRSNTTVAPQALYMLNDQFVRIQAIALTRNQLKTLPSQDRRIAQAYRLVLHRQPSSNELTQGIAFLSSFREQYVAIDQEKQAELAKLATQNVEQAGVNGESPTPAAVPASPEKKDVAATSQAAPEDNRDLELELSADSPDLKVENAEEAALVALTQALLSSAEFRYVR